MATYQVEIAPGQCPLPFSFPLPPELPSRRAATPVLLPPPPYPPPLPPSPRSFHEERGSYKARTCYKLKARPGAAGVVEVLGLLKPNIKNTAQVIVRQRFAQPITQQKKQLETELRVCCCIGRGRVKVETWVDKTAFFFTGWWA
eukprot:tig00021036_g17391.t1